MRRFSRTVSRSHSPGASVRKPMRLRSALPVARPRRIPSMVTDPLVGAISPASIRIVVVLPAPLGPSSATISPCATSRLTSSTAMRAPKRRLRPRAAITGSPRRTHTTRASPAAGPSRRRTARWAPACRRRGTAPCGSCRRRARRRRYTGTASDTHRFPARSTAAVRTVGRTNGSSPSAARRFGHVVGSVLMKSSISTPSI